MPAHDLPKRLHVMGFQCAGASNVLGILVFSQLFTNPWLAATEPAVFSWLGQVSIVLWGLAYMAVAKNHHRVPQLVAVFALEKLVYSLIWLKWMAEHGASIPAIAQDSMLTAVFMSIYGLNDIASMAFFAWVLRSCAIAQSPFKARA